MKRISIFSTALLAVCAAFVSCNKEHLVENEISTTHSISFVADQAETKTTMTIGTDKATFEWEDADKANFHVYENDAVATNVQGTINSDGKMAIAATFSGAAPAEATYYAHLNSDIRTQSPDASCYDDNADVLTSSFTPESGATSVDGKLLVFERAVAINKMTLKGITAGETIQSVTITSDKPIAGVYAKNEWTETATTLTINPQGVAATAEGAVVYFTCLPAEGAMLTVDVTTTDTASKSHKYTKTFTKSITFTKGNVKPFGVTMVSMHTISWDSTSDWTGLGDVDITLTNPGEGYSLTASKNNGGTSPTVVKPSSGNSYANDCRVYAGGSITISNPYPINKVIFNLSAQGLKRLAPISSSDGTISKQSSGDNTVVWTGHSKSITFTVGANANYGSEGASKAGQLCFNTIDAICDAPVEDNVPVESVTIESSKTISVGDTFTLTPSFTPPTATNKNVTWSSNNEAVASVDNGTVTGVSTGSATITVTTSDGGKTSSCIVTVTPVAVQSVSISESETIVVGASVKLLPTFTPANATNQSVTWSSNNDSVATVNDGVVTAVSEGTAEITVTTQDGNRTATCNVTVIKPTVIEGSISDALSGVDDGNIYKVTGIVKNIKNGTYGNFDLVDETNSNIKIYIYGLLDAEGEKGQFASLDIKENDIVTLQGAVITYNSTIEIKDAQYISHKKPATPYQHVFSTKPTTGSNINLSGIQWNIEATNLGGYNGANYAGVQIGTSQKNGQITLTSSSAWSYGGKSTIKEIRLWMNLGGTSVTPTVTVDGVDATSDETTVTKNSSAGSDWTKATKVTFTPDNEHKSGVVKINISTVKAGYICAIEIECD